MKAFSITIDGEPHNVTEHKMAASGILALAVDPKNHYLVEVRGKTRVSYQNEPDKEIELHPGSTFVTVFTGSTTVSDCVKMSPLELFMFGLEELGYQPVHLGANCVAFPYEVELGSRAGQEVTLGFAVPTDFPATAPSGPHVSPHIHAMGGGGVHPTGGIHPARHTEFGPEFQYWSRPFPGWQHTRRSVQEYMAFVRHLWATQ